MPKAQSKEHIPAGPVGAPATIVEPQVAPFVFTGFQPLSTINGKNVASAFGKSEHQSWWTRRADDCTWEAQRHWKKAVMLGGDSPALLASSTLAPQPNNNHHHNQSSSSSSTNEPLDHTTANGTHPAYKLHLQPPSFYQTNPVDPAQRTIVIHPGSRTVLIGRACDPVPISIPNVVARRRVPSKGKQPANGLFRDMEPTPTPEAEATFTSKINAIRTELRSRMRAIKLRGITNGQGIAANHNAENIAPLTLSEDQDPLGTVWPNVSGPDSKDIYIGEDALLIPEPEKFHYAVRWPILRGQLNSSVQSGYASKAEILADIEAVWLYALSTHLGIKEQDLKEYSAIFILPDIYDHVYLREMVDLMFRALGFKQICVQQESLCACFGAGLGSACVVDMGASQTSVSCVEEGWVLPDTRIQLAIGGDDITTVLAGMLRRQNFPYKNLNLNCAWDWLMMEQLKEDMLVLSEADVALSSFSFFVRHPMKPTVKWSVRAYDEVIIPAMILFSPSIIEFDRKLNSKRCLYADKEDVDDVLDLGGNPITEAMRLSTSTAAFLKPMTTTTTTATTTTTTTTTTMATTTGTSGGAADGSRLGVEDAVSGTGGDDGASPCTGTPQPANTLGVESNAPTPRPSPSLAGSHKQHQQAPSTAAATLAATEPAMTPCAAFSAAVSKIPLHEAVVHSILACGSEDRAKRMAAAIMIVGGGALIHNVGYAITTRIQPMLAARYSSIEATTITPPRDLDPRILAWKGVSLLCRIDAASDLWVRSSDWEVLGSKAIKDRTIFMC